ncbi:hypothetical protein DFP72DRAFT_891352 [Ephemerocybe angulata]|uniref:Transcription factor CBF/NF-Y/archaeal histone domain-containing protein n=1 Tax=Ephemerocybe angulata TaxID=980116 RepID=A0A8H6MAY3_9AGAR|nr:hypothetical protein DFP72DRAFT_891352 [Tulosesus angulatus]
MSAALNQEDPDVVMEDELEYESDVEADLEVDELDSSGSDQENPAQPSVSTSKKVTSGKPGTRVPGHTLLPQVRIENILQADGVTGNLALSKDGQFVLSIATEEFIKRLALAGLAKAKANRQQNMVNYTDMSTVALRQREFRFLRETIPEPFALSTAWELRGIRHMELMEEDPALGGIIPEGSFNQVSVPPSPEALTPPIASTSNSTTTTTASKRKKNGVEANGHSSSTAASSSRRPPSINPEIASISTTTSTTKASSSSRGGLKKNGSGSSIATLNGHGKHTAASVASTTGLSTPSEEKDEPMLDVDDEGTSNVDVDEDDEMTGGEPPWSAAQYSEPPMGSLQGPGTAPGFGRAAQDAHGRTIYSQQKNQPD